MAGQCRDIRIARPRPGQIHSPPHHAASQGDEMNILVPMTETGLSRYRGEAGIDYAKEKVGAGRWPEEGALARSEESHARLLPQGLATPGHLLFAIRDEAVGVDVGVLWLAITESPSGRSGYVYDVVVAPEHHRRGHARAAFLA